MKKIVRAVLVPLMLLVIPATFVAAQPPEQPAAEDSLTAALCNNQEQIFSKRTSEYRIDYYMGETQLNMKTMSGFLSLNSASQPYYAQFRRYRGIGVAMMIGGIGIIVADRYIPRPSFPVITLAGIATSILGIKVFIGANDKFRVAIHAYNKDICRIR